MRGERATMGKSLLDVQRELKIKATYIAAIENADLSAFETPGFVAGYVRSYARYLNLDPDWAFRTFCEEGNFDNPAGIGTGPKAPRGSRGTALRRAAIPSSNRPSPSSRSPKRASRASNPRRLARSPCSWRSSAPSATAAGPCSRKCSASSSPPWTRSPVSWPSSIPCAARLSRSPQPRTAGCPPPRSRRSTGSIVPRRSTSPVLVPRDGAIATLDPDTVGVLAADAREQALAAARTAPGAPSAVDMAVGVALAGIGPVAPGVQVVEPPPEVALLAVQPSWVRVQSADGTVIFEKILDAGETFVLPAADEPHRLRAGNAGSLYFSVNGETYGPAGSGPRSCAT